MKRKNIRNKRQHVIPVGRIWGVKTDGTSNFNILTVTKKEALSAAKKLARSKHADVMVHNKNGELILVEVK